MPSIKLIVTGEMERRALPQSLSRFFPKELNGEAVIWETPHCLPGATSARLKPGGKISPAVEKLANTLLAEAKGGKNGKRPDLVVMVDDLELHNLDQPELVATQLCGALNHLLKNNPVYARQEIMLRGLLLERCSFHLFKPLPEAYFFGDSAALQTLGVATGKPKTLTSMEQEDIAQNSKQAHPPKLVADRDLELFETDDPAYLPLCEKINQKQKIKYPHWQEECHPKHYLQFLHPYYEETKGGASALAGLNWPRLDNKPHHLQTIRALFADLANWFNVPNPLPGIADPAYFKQSSDNMLRNL